jgi:hypothetical protein
MKTLKPGLRLKSAVCATEIMVIRAPSLDAVLACGGTEMLGMAEADLPAAPSSRRIMRGHPDRQALRRRARPRRGAVHARRRRFVALDGVAMTVKQAKALPSSD